MKFIARLLLLLPLLEILGFILAGALFGITITLLALLATTLLGMAILRYYKSLSLTSLQQQLRTGLLTNEAIAQNGMLILAGILLLIPGFITDILGLLCLIPTIRMLIYAKVLAKHGQHPHAADSASSRIIEGEARHVDEEK